MCTLYEDVSTFMTISCWILLRMRNILHKIVQKIKTHFMFNNFFRKSWRLCDIVEMYDGARGATNDITIWCVWIACWISKATCSQAHAHAYAPVHKHARAHSQIHTHTNICYLCFFYRQKWLGTHFNKTYVHCLPCLNTATITKKGLRWPVACVK
jgi:hypothetical protein